MLKYGEKPFQQFFLFCLLRSIHFLIPSFLYFSPVLPQYFLLWSGRTTIPFPELCSSIIYRHKRFGRYLCKFIVYCLYNFISKYLELLMPTGCTIFYGVHCRLWFTEARQPSFEPIPPRADSVIAFWMI